MIMPPGQTYRTAALSHIPRLKDAPICASHCAILIYSAQPKSLFPRLVRPDCCVLVHSAVASGAAKSPELPRGRCATIATGDRKQYQGENCKFHNHSE